jgi:hypothetical protein
MRNDTLRGRRYLNAANAWLAREIREELPYLDFHHTQGWYADNIRKLGDKGRALLGCNDRFFLLSGPLHRSDVDHPWVFERCREVEREPDGHLDLWSRYHFKSTIGTLAGIIQELLCDPEITVCILSATKDLARAFLTQIQQELENNEELKRLYPDVLWDNPRKEADRWSRETGIVVKRRSNPKEATVEAHGLIDGQPTSRHYRLLVYDDVVTQDLVGSPDIMKKVTERWELSDNLGTHGRTRKQHFGTRYHHGDTYGVILERGVLKARIYPATDDGTLKGKPVLLSEERWEEVKTTQRSTVSAQMLLNPIAGNEAVFRAQWLRGFEVRPAILSIYILCDPSKGATNRSDRTAIAVIGIDPRDNKYLLDGVCHRMRLSERWQFLKQLYQYWSAQPGVQACLVGYERYGAQVDTEVIEEWQQRDKVFFPIEELAFPRAGRHSKRDRVERLEPDMKRGKFHLPAVVWHPDFGGRDHYATWSVDETTAKISYRPLEGLTRLQRACEATGQTFRIVRPVKRIDENRDVYDLTRAFIEEALFFPFAPHDDLIDAASRLYDMSPTAPVQYEQASVEQTIHPDL